MQRHSGIACAPASVDYRRRLGRRDAVACPV